MDHDNLSIDPQASTVAVAGEAARSQHVPAMTLTGAAVEQFPAAVPDDQRRADALQLCAPMEDLKPARNQSPAGSAPDTRAQRQPSTSKIRTAVIR
jgi:hypothetical protein